MTNDEKALTPIQDAPLAQISREQFETSVARLRAILPDGPKMNIGQLSAVAMHSLLTGTVPGTEVHYFLNGDKLCKVDDYKLLKRWALESERRRTGDPAVTLHESYTPLTDQETKAEGLQDGDVATWCDILSSHDRPEVKKWIDTGLSPAEALAFVGTRAIGVIKKSEIGNTPKGWSPMQKARKLALKAALRFKFGQPSVVELQQQMRAMARGDVVDADWEQVPTDLPPEAQARYAELTAVTRQVIEASAEMTAEDHEERLQDNTDLLRGQDQGAIGEDEPEPTAEQRFLDDVCKAIPYFRHAAHVKNTMSKLGLAYDQSSEDTLLDALDMHARKRADEKAAAAQPELFETASAQES